MESRVILQDQKSTKPEENAQNMTSYYPVISRFDRFRKLILRTEETRVTSDAERPNYWEFYTLTDEKHPKIKEK